MMKQRLQMTIVEPTIRTPAWRSASPKNLRTRPRKTSPKTRAENLTMSPNDAIHSRATAPHSVTALPRVVAWVTARRERAEPGQVVVPAGAVERPRAFGQPPVRELEDGAVAVRGERDL